MRVSVTDRADVAIQALEAQGAVAWQATEVAAGDCPVRGPG